MSAWLGRYQNEMESDSPMKNDASLMPGCRSRNANAMRGAAVAAIFLLCAAPASTRAQSGQPAPMQAPPKTSAVARAKHDARATDYFAGLTFAKDQQAKMDELHQNMKARMDAVVKDQKLNADQKAAMLAGFQRMENRQAFKLLTPEQQKVVRDRIRAEHAADHVETKKQPAPR
jgi:hypothetical protein